MEYYQLGEAERKQAVELLHQRIMAGMDADEALWETVLVYQGSPFYTASGLPFTYTVKRGKRDAYTGEIVISRKEGSKTLTRSSVMLAFHVVRDAMTVMRVQEGSEGQLIPAEYRGPKAIGQIFGISYVYSLFWRWGLIRVPEKVEQKWQIG